MASNRELQIKITVNAGAAKTAVESIKKSLGQVGVFTDKAAAASKKAVDRQTAYVEKAVNKWIRDYEKAAAAQQRAAQKVAAYAEKQIQKQIAAYEKARQAQERAAQKQAADAQKAADKARAYAEKAIQKQIRDYEKAAAAQQKEQQKATSYAERAVQKQIREYEKAAQAQVRAAQRASREEQRAVRQATDYAKRAVAQATQDMQNKWDRARRQAYSLTIAGYQLGAAGKAIRDEFQQTIDVFSEFDWALRRATGAMSDIGEASGNLNQFKDAAIEASYAVKLFDPEQIAMGMYYWGSTTGVVIKSQEDLNKVVGDIIPIMKVAAFTGSDFEATLKSIYGVTEQFGTGMENIADLTAQMYLVTQKTALEFPDLINSLKMVGPVAGDLGVTIEDMLQMLGGLGNATIKGSMAGRAMRQMFIQLERPSAKATKALDLAAKATYGLNTTFHDLVFPNDQFIGAQGYLDVLTKMTNDMTESQRASFLAQISTANELPALTKLIAENAESYKTQGKGITEATVSMEEANATLEQQTRLLEESAKAQFGSAWNHLKGVMIEIGQIAVQHLTPVLIKISEIADKVRDWMKENPALASMAVKIGMITAAVLTAAGAVGIFSGALHLLSGAVLPQVATNLTKFVGERLLGMEVVGHSLAKDVIPKLSAAFLSTGSAAGVAGGEVVAFTGFGSVLSTLLGALPAILGVVGGAIVAVSAAFKAIQLNGDKFGRLFGQIAEIVGGVGVAIGGVIGFLVDLGSAIGETFAAPVLGMVLDFFSGVLDAAKGVVEWIGKTVDGVDELLNAANRAGQIGKPELPPGVASPNPASINTGSINPPTIQQKTAMFAPPSFDEVKQEWLAGFKQTMADNLRAAAASSEVKTAARFAASETGNSYLDALYQRLGIGNEAMQKRTADAIILGLESTNSMVRQRTVDSLRTMGDLYAQDDSIPAGIRGMWATAGALFDAGMDENAKKSEKRAARWGEGVMALFGEGIQSGNMEKVRPQLSAALTQALDWIQSTNPSFRKTGINIMISMARGVIEADPESPVAQKLAGLLTIMASGGPGAYAAGKQIGALFGIGVEDGFAQAKLNMQRNLRRAGETMTADEWKKWEDNYRKNHTSEIKWDQIFPDIKLPKLKDIGGGSSGGSGGGSKASQQSPLEKALQVAQQGADLYEALQKLEGVNLKALVKKVLPGVAKAVAESVKIAHKYAKTVSKSVLKTVANFTETASSVVSLIGESADAFNSLREYKGVSNAKIREIVKDIVYTVKRVYAYAHEIKTSKVIKAGVFSESAEKVVGAIGSAVESFSKIGSTYKRPSQSVLNGLAEDIVYAVKRMIALSKEVKLAAAEAAGQFSEAAGNVVDVIGKAVEVFQNLVTYTKPLPSIMDDIMDSIADAVARMIDTSSKFNMSDAQLASLKSFTDVVAGVANAIGATYDAFVKTIQFVDQFRETINFEKVFTWIKYSVEQMNEIAKGYSEETINKVKSLGDAVGSIASAIDAFFNIGKNASQDPDTLGALVQQALDAVIHEMATFVAAFEQIGANFVDNFIKGMQSRYDALQDAVTQMQTILGGAAAGSQISITTDNPQITIVHVIKDPDGALKAADTTAVAQILSGSQFISNLYSAVNTQ